jgi:hypothetical protein
VGGQHDAPAGDKLRRQPLDRGATMRWNGEKVGGGQIVAPVRQSETAPEGRAPFQR